MGLIRRKIKSLCSSKEFMQKKEIEKDLYKERLTN